MFVDRVLMIPFTHKHTHKHVYISLLYTENKYFSFVCPPRLSVTKLARDNAQRSGIRKRKKETHTLALFVFVEKGGGGGGGEARVFKKVEKMKKNVGKEIENI